MRGSSGYFVKKINNNQIQTVVQRGLVPAINRRASNTIYLLSACKIFDFSAREPNNSKTKISSMWHTCQPVRKQTKNPCHYPHRLPTVHFIHPTVHTLYYPKPYPPLEQNTLFTETFSHTLSSNCDQRWPPLPSNPSSDSAKPRLRNPTS
jgi:hypothetical protein